jgi:ABC-type antimicrobial peptide transport system permease subunit
MEQHISEALVLPRTAALLFTLAGCVGLLIATIGIYGVISFTVARRTREISIRMALWATRARMLGMVLRHGLALSAAGFAIGLGLALALTRVAASLLYGVSATDTLTFLAVPSFLLIVATLACLIPARRAAALDPVRALKEE